MSKIAFFFLIIVFGLDLLYKFGNYDTPFAIGIFLYFVIIFLRRVSSVVTFRIVLALIVIMGIFYLQTGATRLTERVGEWFYLFLLIGLGQYTFELFSKRRENI